MDVCLPSHNQTRTICNVQKKKKNRSKIGDCEKYDVLAVVWKRKMEF